MLEIQIFRVKKARKRNTRVFRLKYREEKAKIYL